jgi:hypothetical protein
MPRIISINGIDRLQIDPAELKECLAALSDEVLEHWDIRDYFKAENIPLYFTEGADFSLFKQTLSAIDLDRAILRKAILCGHNFLDMEKDEYCVRGADFAEADLTNANFKGTVFIGAEDAVLDRSFDWEQAIYTCGDLATAIKTRTDIAPVEYALLINIMVEIISQPDSLIDCFITLPDGSRRNSLDGIEQLRELLQAMKMQNLVEKYLSVAMLPHDQFNQHYASESEFNRFLTTNLHSMPVELIDLIVEYDRFSYKPVQSLNAALDNGIRTEIDSKSWNGSKVKDTIRTETMRHFFWNKSALAELEVPECKVSCSPAGRLGLP